MLQLLEFLFVMFVIYKVTSLIIDKYKTYTTSKDITNINTVIDHLNKTVDTLILLKVLNYKLDPNDNDIINNTIENINSIITDLKTRT